MLSIFSYYLIFSYSILGLISIIPTISSFINWSLYFVFFLNNKDRDPILYFFGIYLMAHTFYCLYYFYSEGFYFNCVSQDNGVNTVVEEAPKICSSEKIDFSLEQKPAIQQKSMLLGEKVLLLSWFAASISLFIIANQMAN